MVRILSGYEGYQYDSQTLLEDCGFCSEISPLYIAGNMIAPINNFQDAETIWRNHGNAGSTFVRREPCRYIYSSDVLFLISLNLLKSIAPRLEECNEKCDSSPDPAKTRRRRNASQAVAQH